MSRTLFRFLVKPPPTSKKLFALFDQWEERRLKLQQQLPYLAAKDSFKNILSRIPNSDELKPYRMALEICKIVGLRPEEVAYAVRLNPKHRKVKTVDASKEILYVRPREDRITETRPEVRILERYNPWTLDTIPFLPKQSQAFVQKVKAGRRRALKVQHQRTRDRRKWQRELSKVGFRDITRKVKVRPKFKYRKKIAPVVLDALRMEFGLDRDPKPHWGPGIRRFVSVGVRSLRRKHPGLTSVLTKLGFRSWRKWPTTVRSKIRLQEAQGFAAFQKKLGIRGTG